MKHKGRQISGPREKIVPILRPDSETGNIIFVVKGVSDLEPFMAMCPAPVPPQDILPGGKTRDNVESPVYKAQLNDWWSKRSSWMAITALRDSPDVEWEKVKLDDPETWPLWQGELKDAGFSDNELGRILHAIMEVNGLNEALVEEARQSFLTIRANPPSVPASPTDGQPITPSGQPATT